MISARIKERATELRIEFRRDWPMAPVPPAEHFQLAALLEMMDAFVSRPAVAALLRRFGALP
jgi:hypothetical protein